MSLRSDSLERLVPDEIGHGSTGRETLDMHLERYAFAAEHARPGRLLDMACGVGYGTRLVTDRVPAIELGLGVDRSEDAIGYARERYANDRTRYVQGDAMAFRPDDGVPFDTIVSLETIEHLPDPQRFVAHVVTLLAPDGVLVASVPTTPSVDVNPHHLHDFTERSFVKMMRSHGLAELARFQQVQSVNPITVLNREEERMAEMRPNLVRYWLTHPGAVCKRAWATVRHGFTNKYLTVAWRRES